MGSVDRRPYERLGATFSQSLLNECSGNLTNKLEMVCIIQDVGQSGIDLYLSDRAKYMKLLGGEGETFFDPRVTFPQINRTIGDFLDNTLELSSLQITVNNADGFFNTIMPGGDLYNGFINKVMVIQIGIGEDGSNYRTVFYGQITKVGGFARDLKSFQLTAKNKFEFLNINFPNQYLLTSEFPYLDESLEGTALPVILGDWTVNLRRIAPSIPGFVVNGKDPLVNKSITDEDGNPNPNVGSADILVLLSINPLSYVNTDKVVLVRGDKAYAIPPSDITIMPGLDNRSIVIDQKGFNVEDEIFIYEDGDIFFFEVKGTSFEPGVNIGNPIRQAKWLLQYYPEVTESELDSSWASFITKLETKGWRTRCWIQDQQPLFEYVNSLLEQIRVESFINNENKLALSSLWFEDFQPSPSFYLNNWDIIKGTLKPRLEDRNVFNSAKAEYGFDPSITANRFGTAQYSNETAVTQMGSKIAKLVTYPNMFEEAHVIENMTEILRLVPYVEFIECTLTPRSIALELGQQIGLKLSIGGFNLVDKFGVVYNDIVTGIVRNIGFDPQGMSIPVKIWMLQMVSFPGSLKNDVVGKIAGYNIPITKD